MSDEPERLVTGVAQALWGDNRFRGHSVGNELAGSTDLWSLLSLAVGHRHLDRAECEMLDDLAVSATAADPRIWPLKMTRLGSAWGNETAGFGLGVLASASAVHGPPLVRLAAELLLSIRAELGVGDADALERIVVRRLDAPGARFPGFGVAVREIDERTETFARACESRGRAPGAHTEFLHAVAEITTRRRGLRVNIGGVFAAAFLDLGFTPAQAPPMVLACIFASLLANAHEGAAQAPAVLRRLPASAIRYVGAPPRKSPRAR